MNASNALCASGVAANTQPPNCVAAPALLQVSQRIVGGTTASISRYPYVVSLRDQAGNHFCGGKRR